MNLLLFLIIVLAILVIILSFFVYQVLQKIKHLTRGKNAESLESIITENNTLIMDLKEKIHNQNTQILEIKKDAMSNIQNIGLVRFNPFKETGGRQSFALAFTDKKKNGVVISSLYARERINVFAKSISNGVSEHTLSDEEQEAIIKSQA